MNIPGVMAWHRVILSEDERVLLVKALGVYSTYLAPENELNVDIRTLIKRLEDKIL